MAFSSDSIIQALNNVYDKISPTTIRLAVLQNSRPESSPSRRAFSYFHVTSYGFSIFQPSLIGFPLFLIWCVWTAPLFAIVSFDFLLPSPVWKMVLNSHFCFFLVITHCVYISPNDITHGVLLLPVMDRPMDIKLLYTVLSAHLIMISAFFQRSSYIRFVISDCSHCLHLVSRVQSLGYLVYAVGWGDILNPILGKLFFPELSISCTISFYGA